MRKSFLIVIALLFLALQSCVVYNKSFISMDEAIKMEKKQKVKLVDPEPKRWWGYKVKEVKMHGDTLYDFYMPKNLVTGYKRPFHIRYATPIPEPYRIYQVHLKNKTASTILTAIGIAIPVGLVIFGLTFTYSGVAVGVIGSP